jgi:hypothetical protein
MSYRWLADLTLLVHAAFVVFVLLGGLAVLRWPRIAWLHVPAAVWGSVVELAGWICPLTPLENELRERAGRVGYGRGFLEHYLLAAIYPEGLTRDAQIVFGILALALNLAIYAWVLRRNRRSRSQDRAQ